MKFPFLSLKQREEQYRQLDTNKLLEVQQKLEQVAEGHFSAKRKAANAGGAIGAVAGAASSLLLSAPDMIDLAEDLYDAYQGQTSPAKRGLMVGGTVLVSVGSTIAMNKLLDYGTRRIARDNLGIVSNILTERENAAQAQPQSAQAR